jgi:hypothetical protein
VSLAGGDLGGRAGGDLGEVDVVHRDLDAVGLAPFLHVAVVPLLVEPGNEVRPDEDLQLLRGAVGLPRNEDCGRDPRRDHADPRRLDEIAPGQ